MRNIASNFIRKIYVFFASRPAQTRRLIWLFAGVLLPLVVFGRLARDIHGQRVFFWDDPTLLYINRYETPGWDTFFVIITQGGRALTLVPLCLILTVWLWRRGKNIDALFFIVATGGAGIINLITKSFFGRARPSLWEQIVHETTYSFPSGHSMMSMAVASALVYLLWKTRWRWLSLALAVPYVLLIGLSRLYLGVHFPSDVLGGWCAGLVWVAGVYNILRIYRYGYWTRRQEYFDYARTALRVFARRR